MTSDVDLCNRALAEIGTRSTITSLAEPSAEAVNCALFYTPLRQQLLRTAPWGFARSQVALTELGNLTDSTAPYPWGFKYAYPSACQKLRFLIATPPDGFDPALVMSPYWSGFQPSMNNRFIVASDATSSGTRKVILTNVYQAIGVFNNNESNPEMFDSLFTNALVMALAAKLCQPLTGEISMRGAFEQLSRDAVLAARAADGNEALSTVDHTPDWIAARNGYVNQPGYGLGDWRETWDTWL